MIIRLSFGDNDITNYFEEFCKGLRNRMFVIDENERPKKENYDSCESYSQALIEFFDRDNALNKTRYHLLDPDNHFKKDSLEYKQIVNEVLRLWRIYAPTVHMENWGDPDISIQYELKEQWENGEATYYWSAADVCITQ